MDGPGGDTSGGGAAGPGDVLAGRYVLAERIGRGGMAEVFRAQDRRLGRAVAVKVLAPHLLQDQAAMRQLQREARAAASIRHPGIVAVHDAGSEGDTHYLVMELVEGPTLADVLRDEGPLPPARAAAVAAAIADAVHAAHLRGVIHRDLKPSNVLFDTDGTPRVTDFGIAHAAASTTADTATTLLAGSAPYLAPEQARGDEPTPAADLYALGCLLFESVTGRRVFEGDTPAAVIGAHLHADPLRPSDVRPELPAWLDDVVRRALAKDPAARQPDAAAFAADLRRGPDRPVPSAEAAVTVPVAARAADDTVVLDPAETGVPPGSAVPRRGAPWRWALAGAVVALLLTGAAVILTPLWDRAGTDPVVAASPTGAPSAPPTTPEPGPTATTPSPAPTTEPEAPPRDPAAAATVVRRHLDEARRSFRIAEDDADELDDQLAKVIEKHREGKADDARKELGELRRKVDEFARKDRIDDELHRDLQVALDDLEATL